MPNWCYNKVVISGGDLNLDSLKQAAISGESFLEMLVPPPVLTKMESENSSEIKWNRANLGCKWPDDSFSCELLTCGKKAQVIFYTPWGPPITAYETLLENGYELYAEYCEISMGFCGYFDGDGDSEMNISHAPQWLKDSLGIYNEDEQ